MPIRIFTIPYNPQTIGFADEELQKFLLNKKLKSLQPQFFGSSRIGVNPVPLPQPLPVGEGSETYVAEGGISRSGVGDRRCARDTAPIPHPNPSPPGRGSGCIATPMWLRRPSFMD